jgi:hypothetical protein
MQQRSGTDRRRAERDPAQPMGTQPHGEGDDPEQPEPVPQFLSAREFEWDRRTGAERRAVQGKTHRPMGNDEDG